MIVPFVLATLAAPIGNDETIGGEIYEALDTRAATKKRMLDLLTPEAGDWGDFHVLSPFPFEGFGSGDLERPQGPEDELAARHVPNGPGADLERVHAGRDGRELGWEPLGAMANRRIDLRRFDGEPELNEHGIAYLYAPIRADETTTVEVPLGSDDGLRLWLNGELLIDKDVARGLDPHADLAVMHLEAGTNHVLAKVTQGVGGWDFQVNTRHPLKAKDAALLEYYLDRDFPATAESADYHVFTLPTPPGLSLEVGGLDFLPDGRPIVCTRRGEIWIVEGADAIPPANARYRLFAEGLHEPLGLAVRQEGDQTAVYCVQRPELTRLVDTDGDDRADLFETKNDDWGVSGNYHEFAFGPKFDAAGNAWVTLNVGFCGALGKSVAPWRGWAVKITPEGELVPVCDGLRSPNGIGRWRDGEMFYVDNQGDWVATCRLTHLAPGSWAGHPASLRWRDDLEEGATPPLLPAAVWFPYGRMGQSVADLALDETDGRFGPFTGQFFTGDQTRATIMRVSLENVDGLYQGACYPFLEGLDSGVNRLAFAADGSLWVGETDRGWGSIGWKRDGLQRVVWRGTAPFEIREVRATPQGFLVEFTAPVDDAATLRPDAWRVTSHTYAHHADYGAPEIDRREHAITGIARYENSVHLALDELRTGYVYAIEAGDEVRGDDGRELVHREAYYTLQRVPATMPEGL